jgi:hypothetical protein
MKSNDVGREEKRGTLRWWVMVMVEEVVEVVVDIPRYIFLLYTAKN